ncbi:MAG: GumC family protein, partial [Planctomycetota bacterium]
MSGFGLILNHYVRRGLANRWVVLVPTVAVFALVTVYMTIQEDVYEASSLLMTPIARPVDGASRADAETTASTMFRSAMERLLSTAVLQRVAEEIDPYPELREARGLDAVIERLRGHIRIDVNHASGGITVIFSHSGGERPHQLVADVVNCLTDKFVLSQRDALGDKSAAYKKFLDQELRDYSNELDRAQNAVKGFKEQHPGSLPEDVPANREEVRALHSRIQECQRGQQYNVFTLESLARDEFRLRLDIESVAKQVPPPAEAVGAAQQFLQSLEQQRIQDLVRYEPDSPYIKKLDEQIRSTRERLERMKQETGDQSSGARMTEWYRFILDENVRRQKDLREESARVDDTIRDLNEQISEANKRIVTASTLESQLASLQRAADEAERKRRDIQDRKNYADFRNDLFTSDPTAPIQVEQRAFVPARPAGPDRLTTSLIGL